MAVVAASRDRCEFQGLRHVNLDGRMSFPVAETLDARGLPYIFVTGYGPAGVDPAFRKNSIVMQKPFDLADLRASIQRLNAARGGRKDR